MFQEILVKLFFGGHWQNRICQLINTCSHLMLIISMETLMLKTVLSSFGATLSTQPIKKRGIELHLLWGFNEDFVGVILRCPDQISILHKSLVACAIRWMRVNDLSHAFILDASTIIYLFPGCILAYILSRNLTIYVYVCIYIYTYVYIYIF
jgi:hypothetical protein